MKTRRRLATLVAALGVIGLAAMTATAAGPPIPSSKTLGSTHGPAGEKASPTSALKLTAAEIAKVKKGNYTAALVWHQTSDFEAAVTAGARDTFKQLGIKI
ncbi:MAG: ribose transport system substrate-binding protein, partial [Gaiellaceae bacterium]|nr:ribose transport system substrate-binding protein [Gaiellaceae bacterium]